MIKFKKIDSDIFKLLKGLPAVFEGEKRICLAYLFGSFAINKINELSDVDIAYLLSRDKGLSFGQEMELAGKVAKALKTDEFDLIQLNQAPAFFSYKVISTGKTIYSRSRKEKEDFESQVFMQYLDMKPMRDMYFRQMMRHIRERK